MQGEVTTVTDLLTRAEFLTGFTSAIIGLVLLYFLSREVGRNNAAPGWAIIVVLANLVAINASIGRSLSLMLALAAFATGGWILEQRGDLVERAYGTALGWGLAAAGAFVLSWRTGLPDEVWVRVSAPLVALFLARTLQKWTEADDQRWLGPMFAISAFGIWTAVPDTDTARALIGSAIPLALATSVRSINARMVGTGAFALAGLVTWVVAVGGEPRPASIIGGWACMGVIAALPYIAGNRTLRTLPPWLLIGGHGFTVLIAARLIGLQWSVATATVGVVVLSLPFIALALLVNDRRATSDHHGRTRDSVQ